MTRNFFLQKNNADKFWRITITENSLVINYGNCYDEPKTTTKEFDTVDKCQQFAEKIIGEKLSSGYEEIPLNLANVEVAALKKVADAQKYKKDSLEVRIDGSVELLEIIYSIRSLETLKLYRVSVLSPGMSRLINLTTFTISSSPDLTSIPDDIGDLVNLKSLSIDDTGIQELPDTIGNLSNLEYLSVDGNKNFNALPTGIGRLEKLHWLSVFSNRSPYQEQTQAPLVLPGSLSNLNNLTRLNLSQNNISVLPLWIKELQKLDNLNVSRNPYLFDLPDFVFSLANLSVLDISDCPISILPPALCHLEKLKYLKFDEGPIKNVPDDILEEGLTAIKQYLSGVKGQDIVRTPKKLPNPNEILLNEYQTVYDCFLPQVVEKNILDPLFITSSATKFTDKVSGKNFELSLIKDIGYREGGLLAQQISGAISDQHGVEQPIGFADLQLLEGQDEFTYQLCIFHSSQQLIGKENDLGNYPVFLVKFTGYPMDDFDDEEEESDFQSELYQVADSFEEFIQQIFTKI